MADLFRPLDFTTPIPDDIAEELEKLFCICFKCLDEKKRYTIKAGDRCVSLDWDGLPISPARTISKIHAAKGTAIVGWQGLAPFGLIDIGTKRREKGFADALMGRRGEMDAVFVPTFLWCVIRNHDTPPAYLRHAKPRRLREQWSGQYNPEIPQDRVNAVAQRVRELADEQGAAKTARRSRRAS